MGYTAGMGRRLPGYGAALMMGIGETCGYLIRVGSLLIVLFPLYLFRMIGAGDIKMAAVLFGAAGCSRAGRFSCAGWRCRIMVTCITYPAWDCQAAAYISCVLFVPVRAWGKRRAVLSGSAGWKRGIFLSGTVPVSGGDWGGADSVSVGEMVCD